MSDRLEYAGDPLPSGLPGFGGGTVDILTLPGFNRVVAAQKFGPVNDAPTVTPPDPQPPTGSNPENPTNEVVEPSAAPVPQSGASSNFCERCVAPDYAITKLPILMAEQLDSGCVDCQGFTPGKTWQPEIAAYNNEEGIFWDQVDGISGNSGEDKWSIDSNELLFGADGQTGMSLTKYGLAMQGTEYRTGAVIYDINTSRTYRARELQVCVSGTSKTWYVLAHEV